MSEEPPYDAEALRAEVLRPGTRWSRLDVVAETGSTNADLADRARAGEPAGAVLITDYQSAGRGRQGRTWTAPPGSSIAVSVLLRPDVPAERWSWLPLLTGLAVSDALRAVADVPAVLKWPNDVLVEDRKLSGILAERVVTDTGPACVLGLGVNVGLTAADLPVPTATSLALLHPDRPRPRTPIVAAVLADLDLWLGRWEVGSIADLQRSYTDRCVTLDREVELQVGDRAVRGRAERIEPDGRLVLFTSTGEQIFGAGDVLHLR